MEIGPQPWRTDAFAFLDELRESLRKGIDSSRARTYKLEGPFLKDQVVPKVHSFLKEKGYLPEEAREALRAEGYDTAELKQLVSGTPASKPKYPFKKGIAEALRGAKKDWWQKGKGLYACCPDFAIHSPHKIVFEGKFFREGSIETAKSCLARGIYECTFYRGLPTLLMSETAGAGAYDFGCLFVYDASRNHAVLDALQGVNAEVRKCWWTELKIFVMVVG